ncbi:MAG: DUF1638 domain-containing protein [Deltaproteobacteria bacterium]|nr:DUF1638 domain-containing protein [Deltaproteobacteria bacterium]
MSRPSIALLVCENLAKEANAAIPDEARHDVSLVPFPARCGRPPLEREELERLTRARGVERAHVAIVGARPCTHRLADEGVRVHCSDQCFYSLTDAAKVDELFSEGAHVVTPGWLRRWRLELRRLGLDQATARALFGESVRRIVLLDTGLDPAASGALSEFAEFVGLPAETLPVGLEFHRAFLARIVYDARLEAERAETTDRLARANRQSAEYAMAFELIGGLTALLSERDVIARTLAAVEQLFAPGALAYHRIDGAVVHADEGHDSAMRAEELLCRLGNGDAAWSEEHEGFVLRIAHEGRTLGVLAATRIAFPEHRERYVGLAQVVARVCGLAVSNARAYERVKEAEARLSRLAAENERLYREAQEAIRVRDQVFAGVAHDLGNPLSVITLGAEQLLRQAARAGGPEWLPPTVARISAQAGRLAALAADLVDLACTGAGRPLDLRTAPTDLVALTHEVARSLASTTCRHDIRVQAAVPELRSAWDGRRLERVVTNLISNAIKYSPEGGPIDVTIAADASRARLAVRDSGIGVPAEDLPGLFEPFFRARNVGRLSGTGIGLANARTIVEAHGGDIAVESEEGRGTTITVTLPLG